MKCAICYNEDNNRAFIIKEMMFGLRDEFKYFECAKCGCFQIDKIPDSMDRYYPDDYYSLNQPDGGELKISYFKMLQFDHLSGYKPSALGALASYQYNPKKYKWFKNLKLKDKSKKILDIGSGSGELLKQLFKVGFTNLTGIDPYIKMNKIYNKHLRNLKTTIFEVEGAYDIIMMHHSLEHLPDQGDVISRIDKLLLPGGQLLIRIPVTSDVLFQKYGVNLVSLDAPRHFFIHSIKSIELLLENQGIIVRKAIYDTELLDIVTSEQYLRDISMNDPRSYSLNKKRSVFSSNEIGNFKKFTQEINEQCKGATVALYIERK
jgi:2-polyprenyl-3-methyl-5-hydroxy-6-metoxy-1,4-benzoquinol methylase